MNISANPSRVPNEVLVKFRGAASLTTETDFFKAKGATLLKTFDFGDRLSESLHGDLTQVQLPEGLTPEQAIEQWQKDKRVEYVATNDYVHALENGEEKLNPKSWALHNTGQTGGKPGADIHALEAWQQQTGKGPDNDGPVIAVIDTGIDLFHEALKPNLWTNPNEIPDDGIDNDGNGVVDDVHGFNIRSQNGLPLDENGHGTHCATIIGAADGNSQNISGVMKRTQIAGVQFLNKLGMGKLSDAIEGIAYADRIGARIVSSSWGGGPYNKAMLDVIAASPALHVIAAGNDGSDNDRTPTYPASYDLPNIVAVAATDHNDQLAEFSNYGKEMVDLGAPGVDIYSGYKGGGYKSLSGTSMATPFVAGTAGLIVSEFPNISNADLKTRLLNSTDPVDNLQAKTVSGGRLNAARAIERDTVAPAPITDLVARHTAPGRVALSFTPTGDDGLEGMASRYQVSVSSTPFQEGTANPDARVVAWGRPDGKPVNLEISTPRWGDDKTLYYSVQSQDNVGNLGAPAVARVDLPASRALFEPKQAEGRDVWASRWDWTLVDDPVRGKVWTDSPDGNYSNSSSWMKSTDIDLSTAQHPKLVFEARTDLENERDFLNIEIGVKTRPLVYEWRTVAELTGTHEWGVHEIDLSKYAGKQIQVNFKLQPDGARTQDGAYLQNITLVDEAADSRSP